VKERADVSVYDTEIILYPFPPWYFCETYTRA